MKCNGLAMKSSGIEKLHYRKLPDYNKAQNMIIRANTRINYSGVLTPVFINL